VKLTFDTHGNEKQKLCAKHWIDNTTTDIVYGGSKGSAKSYTGCSLIFGDAFIYPNTHYFIARKKLNDLRKYTIPSIYEVIQHWGVDMSMYRFNGQDNMFNLYNGSKVFLLDAKFLPSDPTYARFGSMQMTRGWIEEAGDFELEAKNNLAASIGRWNNDQYNLKAKLLQTCNPSKNYLYKDYYLKHKQGKLESYKAFIQALPTDNKKIATGYIEHLNTVLSANEKERLLRGNWEYDDDPATLCDYQAICDIFTNEHVPHGTKYITADIARLGKDTTTIRVWSGWRVLYVKVIEKSKINESADAIRQLASKYAIPMSNVIVDESGVGGGVVDLLHCIGFVANAKPLPSLTFMSNGQRAPENFDILKSQCGFKLAEIINSRQIYEKADDNMAQRVIEQLEQLKQKSMDSDQKRGLTPKDDVKAAIGYSPDDMDTYIMRAWFEYRPKMKRVHTNFN